MNNITEKIKDIKIIIGFIVMVTGLLVVYFPNYIDIIRNYCFVIVSAMIYFSYKKNMDKYNELSKAYIGMEIEKAHNELIRKRKLNKYDIRRVSNLEKKMEYLEINGYYQSLIKALNIKINGE